MEYHKIKILFLIHDLGHGGAERVLVNLVNNMDHDRFDITVMSLFSGGVNEQFISNKVTYKAFFKHRIPGNSRLMLLFSPEYLHNYFIKEHYDIEISYLEGPCTRIISGCKDKNTHLVAWLHSDFSKELNNPFASFRNPNEAIIAYKKFDKVVGVSRQVIEDFLKFYPNVKSSCIIYNTNDTEKILKKANEAVENGLFSINKVNFISAGKLTAVKSFERLLRAIGEIIFNHLTSMEFHLYILGKGEDEEKLNGLSKQLNIEDYVTFLGFKENPYKYIKKADVYICSSLREGFSTAVTEALILGKPVVTTNISGMDELLGNNNEHGLLVENSVDGIKNGILNMLNKEVREHYTHKAVDRGKVFSTQKTVSTVQEMLFNLG